jgi:uncharacterized protein YbbC (DUF1343 family)
MGQLKEGAAPSTPHPMEPPPCALTNRTTHLLLVLACAGLAILSGGCAGPGGMAEPETQYALAPISPQIFTPSPVPSTPVPSPTPSAGPRVALGIDVLAEQNFSILHGQRVGLLTHPPGVNDEGVSTIDILRRAPGVKLVALFAPEHGIDGKVPAGEDFPITKYKDTGLMVYPLFGKTRTPPAEWLKNIDVMVIDLQDLGTRSYTFISCLRLTMEACFEQNKTVVVLDRPNPLGGLKVGGPILEEKWMSYEGEYPIPYVFGLTIGELARIAKDTPGWLDPGNDNIRKRGKLIIVPMRGWRRSMVWADTGLKWIPTSPNIPSVGAAFGYSLTGLGRPIEKVGQFAFGVGTPYPFRLLNYPGHKPAELAATMNGLGLAGLHFDERNYRDGNGDHSGVYVNITNWNAVDPTKLAFEMMKLDAAWAPGGNPYARLTSSSDERSFNILVGTASWLQELRVRGGKANLEGYFKIWDAQDAAFQQWTRQWWLYPE